MFNSSVFANEPDRLFIRPLSTFYDRIAQPMAWSIFRLAVGGMLVVEGWPKIMAPLAQVGFVEGARLLSVGCGHRCWRSCRCSAVC